MLEKSIPAWVLGLVLILGVIWTILFGWMVRDADSGGTRFGQISQAAGVVADFPETTLTTLRELKSIATGAYKDAMFSLGRPEGLPYGEAEPMAVAPGIDVKGLMIRLPAGAPAPAPGWRTLAGVFDIDGNAQNAILTVSPDLEVVRAVPVGEVGIEGLVEPQPERRKFLHGIEILPDGSAVVTFDGGKSVQRVDACGKRLWATPGDFSHSVSRDPDGKSVWVVQHDGFARLAIADGKVIRHVTVDDLARANPDTDIFKIRFSNPIGATANFRESREAALDDPWHFNDVDALSAELAPAFPRFRAGDLLVSMRSLNTVFVVDPDTLALKWWSTGTQTRQHDPDWATDGTITLFDNRMGRGDHSNITKLYLDGRPQTAAEKVIDGAQMDFFSRIRGKHQELAGGRQIVTSPQQGRAFEWDPQAGVVMEVYDLVPDNPAKVYSFSEMMLLPPDYHTKGLPACP